METIDVFTAHTLNRRPGVLLLDVRTPAEFESVRIDGAINVPLDQLDAHLPRIADLAPQRIVLICQSGGRAKTAHARLSGHGLSQGVVLDGGMNAWVGSRAPVQRGRERWSLERQVRFVAGLLVFLSVVLSLWTPWSLIVAGAVGVGLAYAGASDTCMMGMLLARLPYNRAAAADPAVALARLSPSAHRPGASA